MPVQLQPQSRIRNCFKATVYTFMGVSSSMDIAPRNYNFQYQIQTDRFGSSKMLSGFLGKMNNRIFRKYKLKGIIQPFFKFKLNAAFIFWEFFFYSRTKTRSGVVSFSLTLLTAMQMNGNKRKVFT